MLVSNHANPRYPEGGRRRVRVPAPYPHASQTPPPSSPRKPRVGDEQGLLIGGHTHHQSAQTLNIPGPTLQPTVPRFLPTDGQGKRTTPRASAVVKPGDKAGQRGAVTTTRSPLALKAAVRLSRHCRDIDSPPRNKASNTTTTHTKKSAYSWRRSTPRPPCWAIRPAKGGRHRCQLSRHCRDNLYRYSWL